MSRIIPTVGRIVLYHPPINKNEVANLGPYAGIVTYVWSDSLINLAFFDANGGHGSRTSVTLVGEGDPVSQDGGYASWMPYQQAQQNKHAVEIPLPDPV